MLRPLGPDLRFRAYLHKTWAWYRGEKRVSLAVVGLVLAAARLVLAHGVVVALAICAGALTFGLMVGFWFFRRHRGELAVDHPWWPFERVRRKW